MEYASNKIKNWSAGAFIGCIVILTFISVLGIWHIFQADVIRKSFETIGFIGFIALVVVFAGSYLGDKPEDGAVAVPQPQFRSIRNITLITFIASATILALVGILSIWDVIDNATVLAKTIATLSVLAFSSLIIVLISLQREQSDLWRRRGKSITGTVVLGLFIFLWIFLSVFYL